MKNTAKKNNVDVNFADMTIEVSKAFYEKASKYGTDEFNTLLDVMKELPGFKVVIDKKTYNGLTIEKMEEYIVLVEKDNARLDEFHAIEDIAKARGAKYPILKKWFLATYPEYKTTDVDMTTTEKVVEIKKNNTQKAEENDSEKAA